jgi:nitrogenase subunit NifH
MSEPTINTSASLQMLWQAYTDRVLATIIPRNTDMKDAMFNKRDIFSFNPRAKAAQAYDKLIRELFNRCSTYEKDTQYPGNTQAISTELSQSRFFHTTGQEQVQHHPAPDAAGQ